MNEGVPMGTTIGTCFSVFDLFLAIDTITALMRVLEKILVRLLISSYHPEMHCFILGNPDSCCGGDARTCTKSSLQQVQVLLGLEHPRDSKATKISRSLT